MEEAAQEAAGAAATATATATDTSTQLATMIQLLQQMLLAEQAQVASNQAIAAGIGRPIFSDMNAMVNSVYTGTPLAPQ